MPWTDAAIQFLSDAVRLVDAFCSSIEQICARLGSLFLALYGLYSLVRAHRRRHRRRALPTAT